MIPQRALVVDDEEVIRRLLARLLCREGWQVETATGCAADATLNAGPFELAMIDVDLGAKRDGVAMAQILRRKEPGLRIVLMSGNPANAGKVQAAGFGEMLPKPFDLSAVTSILRNCR